MVSAALLRDPEVVHRRLHPPREAVGCAGDVQLDPAALLPALDRQVAGPFGHLPTVVQAVFLASGDRRSRARLGRRLSRQAADGGRGTNRRGLLFPSLPGDPALVSRFETPLPLPMSITESVLHGSEAEVAPAPKTQRRAKSATAAAE